MALIGKFLKPGKVEQVINDRDRYYAKINLLPETGSFSDRAFRAISSWLGRAERDASTTPTQTALPTKITSRRMMKRGWLFKSRPARPRSHTACPHRKNISAITVILFTLPGTLTSNNRYDSKTIELFGASLGSEILRPIRNVADIKGRHGGLWRDDACRTSGHVVLRLRHPGHRLPQPAGYDDATRNNGCGQDDFMHVQDKRTKPHRQKRYA